jgi:hypothetical protein
MMSLGWQFQKLIALQQIAWQPQFILAHQEIEVSDSLLRGDRFNLLNSPFQLWLVNFKSSSELTISNCFPDDNYRRRATGYKYRLYNCNL